MISVNNNDFLNNNTIYNEGKNSKNENESFQSVIGAKIEVNDGRISEKISVFPNDKAELLSNIKAICDADIDNSAKIASLEGILSGYNAPSICIYALAANKGKLSIDSNGKLNFAMNLTGVNIGKIYSFSWREDGEKSITCKRASGSSIMQLDEDEIKELFSYIDAHNEEVKQLIEEEIENRIEKEKEMDDKIG